MAVLVRIEPARGDLQAPFSELSYSKEEITIGRLSTNDVVLQDPQVSGRHARILNGGPGKVSIEDVGSSNGTFVEDSRLESRQPAPLAPGQRVVIGGFVITVEAEKPAAAVPEPPLQEAPLPQRKLSALEEQEIKIKFAIRERLIERLDLRRKDIIALTDADLRHRAQRVVEQVLIDMRWEIPEGLVREKLVKQILDEALGLGPVEELLADDSVSEVMVNSFNQIYCERNGRLELTDLRFSSEQAVLAAIERILAPIGRRIDESSPLVDARLKDGSRVNAVIRLLALRGPCITIRKFPKHGLTVEDLVRFGSLSR